jgi:hypothetical protein
MRVMLLTYWKRRKEGRRRDAASFEGWWGAAGQMGAMARATKEGSEDADGDGS